MCITNALFLRDRNEQSPSPRPCPSIPGGRPAPEFRLLPPAPSQAAVPVRSPQLGPGLHPIEPPGPPPQNPVRGLRLLLSITPRSSVPFPSNPQLRSSSRSPPPAYPSPQAPAPLLRPQPPSQPPPGKPYRPPPNLGTDAASAGSETEGLPYPALAPVVFFYLTQESRPRSWCLRMLVFLDLAPTWFERVSMLVILLNCVTLGMFQPCEDIACDSQRCRILQGFDDFIFAFFAVEMIVKMVALGIFGKKCYLGDTWNRLDFFIVIAGMLEYSLDLQNVSLSAVRTVRVLRPLRAINRVPSMRILVTLLLDTLPMLGNVLLLCFFVFFIFGIVGVQLWAGLLRNRCFLPENFSLPLTVDLERYYQTENEDESPFICSQPRENGMRSCRSVPLLREEGLPCSLDLGAYNSSTNTTCVNWNQYYTNCSAGEHNPFKGAINFDNIGYAWIAIFQVITLEGWVDIMYFVMDAHSFYNFIYFILLIIVGSFFMINLCLVVIATQFSETKQRESQLMKEQRARFLSNASTLASFSEPGSCYEELLKYVVYVLRKGARRLAEVSRLLASPGGRPGPETPAGKERAGRRERRRPRRRPQASVHHLIHHHHHHHHHYHLGNGSPRTSPELGDVEPDPSPGPGRLTLPAAPSAPAPPAHPPGGGAESVHSVYHADCHFEPVRRSASGPGPEGPGGGPAVSVAGGKVYPTVHPGPSPEELKEKLLGEAAAGPGPPTLTNLNIPPGSYGSVYKLSCRLAGRGNRVPSSPCGPCSPDNCPYCAQALAGEAEFTDEDSDSEGVYEFSQDPQAGDGRGRPRARRPSRPLALWALVCETFRKIVDSKYFGRGIMIAILVNTLSMGVEYHEQPEELTNALEISNIVFTSLFALEMLLKILVYGPFGYIKNPYNIFDGIIVVISVWEIVGQQGGGLSVLRTFRLMRVLKLVRFMPALQRQLVVLMKTMDNVATFCMLLMLFIFIFSILGMHLFGCKFASERDGDTLPDRKNFDSLLWAIVTVFQILTQEDWNKVLYNGMASTSSWAALYFIALMTFGNYVLFNLLVAILVEGFQTEGDATKSESEADFFSHSLEEEMMSLAEPPELRKSLTPPLIIHTAPTPMPMPRCSGFGDGAQGAASRRASSVSADPCACETKSPPSARSSPHSPWSSAGSWTSRRSSWNSLGRAPSLKRRSQSGERRSLLSGDGQESLDEGESSDEEPCSGPGPSETTPGPPTRTAFFFFASPPRPSGFGRASCPGDGGRAAGGSSGAPPASHWHLSLLQSPGERVRAWIGARLPACCRERDSWSAFIFPPQSRFRLMCHRTITHKMFDHIVLVIIFLNCITIAMERPKIDPHSAERIFLTLSNYIFTVIFLAEMTVKVVALGWCFGERAYLKSSWNVLDGVLVLISVIDILVSLVSDSGTKILGMLRVLRLLRTLRPLRVISRAQGLKLVVETLMSSLKPIGNIVVICCAFFIIFGILGVQLFKGKFFVCQGEDTRNITNKSDCAEASYRWVRHKYNFDNLGQALMSLFVLASKDGWVDIMYDGLDAVGVDQQPVMNYNPWMLLYFISFLLIVAFFVLNMFVGVVVENFHKCRQHQEEEEARRREEKRLRRLEKKRRSKEKQMAEAQCKPYYSDYSRFRLLVHQLCTSHYLDLFITGVIGLNVITMAMEHYQQPKVLDEALKICNYIFTVIFVLESVFKLMAFGFRRFFQDRWNQLDLAIVLLSIMGITLEEIEVNASLPINPTIIRIMRVLRIARGESSLAFGRPTAAPVSLLLFQVGNLGLLFMLLFFIFAALGVELFGDLECDDTHLCEGLGRHATFRNFGMAFLTLFRVSTGDNWNGIMKDTLRDCDQESTCYNTVISPIYFVSFVLTAQFVLVNVVIAVLMKHLEESNKQAKEEAELEAELELEMKTVGPLPPAGEPFPWPGLLSVRKLGVGRAHSLPNDSYMFQAPEPSAPPAQRTREFPKSQSGKWRGGCGGHLGRVSARCVCGEGERGRDLERCWARSGAQDQQRPSRSLRPTPQPPWPGQSPSPGRPARGDRGHPEGSGMDSYLEPFSPDSCPAWSSRSGSQPAPGPAASGGGVGTLKDLKKCYSVDTQGRLRKPPSWLDDQRRHSIEVSSLDSGPQPHAAATASGSSGFISQGLSELEARPGGTRPKKKLSPPCISIDPPEGQGPGPFPRAPLSLSTVGAEVCLRRRAPSCDSHKDSGEADDPPLPPVGAAPAPSPPPTRDLLTLLPTFSFDPTDSEL
uniref:Voltage-dependent T-type calcium channel subunit alpha-1G n=1 Tax=Ornithorhynchus anatinus TaxID=9258 RepID=F7AXB6_ORNAN